MVDALASLTVYVVAALGSRSDVRSQVRSVAAVLATVALCFQVEALTTYAAAFAALAIWWLYRMGYTVLPPEEAL